MRRQYQIQIFCRLFSWLFQLNSLTSYFPPSYDIENPNTHKFYLHTDFYALFPFDINIQGKSMIKITHSLLD